MDKRGFTLIELMVVIAIIAILAAMVIPVFMKYHNRSVSENEIVIEDDKTNETLEKYKDEIEHLRKELKKRKSNDRYGDTKDLY